jgi:hypothetical protein
VESHSLLFLAGAELGFVRCRAEIAEAGVPPAGVIEALDVLANGHARLGTRGKGRAPDQPGLDRLEDALDGNIPPGEAEAAYFRELEEPAALVA